MRVLSLGQRHIGVDMAAVQQPEIRRFVERATVEEGGDDVSYTLHVADGDEAELLVEREAATAFLTLPPTSTTASITAAQIAILQAAARSVALHAPDQSVLLHGSAVRVGGEGTAVAVLDGGRGQGKTSLAFGLARRGHTLVVDEFSLCTIAGEGVAVSPAPRLPWHIRTDMAPFLVPRHLDSRLLFPDQLTAPTCASITPTLAFTLIPDDALPAGKTASVNPEDIDALLLNATTDHLTKLVDPRLDHVSPFASPDQIRFTTGRRLIDFRDKLCRPSAATLATLARIPAFRVGVGAPADIWTSVDAVQCAIGGRQ